VIRWLGFLLTISACAATGWRARQALRNRVGCLDEARRIAEQLRLHVCVRRIPLPQLLHQLEMSFPGRFARAEEMFLSLRDVAFCDYWRTCLAAGGFTQEASKPLIEAVEAISCGQIPERAMEICDIALSRLQENAREQERERGKLYLAFGTAGGCFLALILL